MVVFFLDKEFFTVLDATENLYEEKKSRFIANLKHVVSEDEALCFIESIKKKYKDATHNTFACDILSGVNKQKYSDDGEPQGTAGVVILEVLKKRELKNIVVVVTRYFGGVMLGAGGLARAYSKAASLCLDKAEIIKKVYCTIIEIKVDYNLSGKVQNFLLTNKYYVENVEYTDIVTFKVIIPVDIVERLESQILDHTFATAKISKLKQGYFVIS